MHFPTLLSAAAFVPLSLAGYSLEDDYMTDFYGSFDFFTDTDPTNGFVKYVDQTTAQSMNLINASTTVPVEWGVDTTNKDEGGRASVRLTSKKIYNHGLVVVDVQHMPFGCGTWPAFWMVGPNWPNSGEIDIIEGVHEQSSNLITLHTGDGCSVGQDTSVFSGTVDTNNCDIKAAGQDENKGCSIKQSAENTYGAGLNNNGGGVYATEWTSDAITVWFFPRGNVPSDALGDNPNPSSWDKPAAKFVKSGCNIDQFFKNQQIVFDTTFCGDWAGRTWSSSTCASKAATCNDYVRDNPQAFTDAFWTINALKVYSDNGATPEPSSPVSSAQSSAIPIPTGAPTGIPTSSGNGLPSVIPSVNPPKSSVVVPPIGSTSAVIPPIASTSVVVPPVGSTSIVAPPGGASSSHRTRPHHGRPTQSLNAEVGAEPSGNGNGNVAGGGTMGDFNWPQPTGKTTPETPTTTSAPFPAGNSTAAIPTGTASFSLSLSSINHSTASTFPASIPPELTSSTVPGAPAETPATDLETMPTFGSATTVTTSTTTTPPVPTVTNVVNGPDVFETVWQTVTVTVAGRSVQETPAAGPQSRKARHARMHRRRMVQHNGRK